MTGASMDVVPMALLRDTQDGLRRARRVIRALNEPEGAVSGSRIDQTAIEAVLRGTDRRNPAERALRDHDAALVRAARALDDLDARLEDAGVLSP